MNNFMFLIICLWFMKGKAYEDEVEEDELITALCEKTISDVSQCGSLLPVAGQEIVYGCCRNATDNFRENMMGAAEMFCDRDDIRDSLFLCWEKDLAHLYDTSQNEIELEKLNSFQICLQKIFDKLFDV
ncbi:uncharacterized protein [Parasteatoda tepidariorum]|uniref:uncharacterized protein isoform X2 n=1 Tax=Parasteatoda tepidariorum TaxID=114398 RepID=UPI00077FC207|nr:uncharacterized protein LOC107444180 isoform X2 [Parasteatoda tepidariorum]